MKNITFIIVAMIIASGCIFGLMNPTQTHETAAGPETQPIIMEQHSEAPTQYGYLYAVVSGIRSQTDAATEAILVNAGTVVNNSCEIYFWQQEMGVESWDAYVSRSYYRFSMAEIPAGSTIDSACIKIVVTGLSSNSVITAKYDSTGVHPHTPLNEVDISINLYSGILSESISVPLTGTYYIEIVNDGGGLDFLADNAGSDVGLYLSGAEVEDINNNSATIDGSNCQLIVNYTAPVPQIVSIDMTPSLNFTYFGNYTVDVLAHNATTVLANASGINGDATGYWNYYVNGTPGSSAPTSLSMTHGTGDNYSAVFRPDQIYPEVYYAPNNVTWYNVPNNTSAYRGAYHIFNFTNNFTMGENMSVWFEFNAAPISATKSSTIQAYIVGTGENLTYFEEDWREKDNTELMGTVSRTTIYDHRHTSNSTHYVVHMGTHENGTVGDKSINISGQFWIVLYQDSLTAARGWALRYHNDTVWGANNSANWFIASRSGGTWGSPAHQNGIPDAHMHFARSSTNIDGVNITVWADGAENWQEYYFGTLPNVAPEPSMFLTPGNGTVSGTVNITWAPAKDANDDAITYDLYLTYTNGTVKTHLLTTNETYFTWYSTSVQNGYYDLKVVVSDGNLTSQFNHSDDYEYLMVDNVPGDDGSIYDEYEGGGGYYIPPTNDQEPVQDEAEDETEPNICGGTSTAMVGICLCGALIAFRKRRIT